MVTLVCSCESTEFVFDARHGFECINCGNEYTEEEAGEHLLDIDTLEDARDTFVLMCSCGCTEFVYDEDYGFECTHCRREYTDDEAGSNLIGIEE